MLTYACRQELIPQLALEPILHYYPLMACCQEPRAPLTVWKNHTGMILGAVVPCDPPGSAWLLGGSAHIISALLEEIPADSPMTLPLWADSIVRGKLPARLLSTEVIAVCTSDSFRRQEALSVTMKTLEAVPEMQSSVVTAPVRVAHLGCFLGQSLAGYCTYRLDGQGAGSIEKLTIGREFRGMDLGRTLVAAATGEILDAAERAVFVASGENQRLLGLARAVGFRSCYWLRAASSEPLPETA